MKHLCCFLFSILFFLNCLSSAQESPKGDSGILNVTDYGAIPNDGKDDAEAIMKAVEAAKRIEIRPSSYMEVSKGLFFPSGVYDISKTIECHKGMALFSTPGKAIIRALKVEEKEPEVLFRFFSYTNTVKNLKFVGGETQLYFHNPNINQCTVTIEGCEFYNSTGFAIRAVPTPPKDHLSMLMTIANCKFLANKQCLETYCDYCVMRDCWLETGQPWMADGPVCVNRMGHLFLERVVCVPCADASKGKENLENCRWVDNYASFTARETRFGAEGAGIPVVYQYEPKHTYWPHTYNGGTIDIQSCYVFTGSERRKNAGVITLFHLPHLVVFANNIGPANNKLFRYAPEFDIQQALQVPTTKNNAKFIKFVIGANLSYPEKLEDTIQPELLPFVVKGL